MAVDPEVWSVDIVRLGGMGRTIDGWSREPSLAPVLACVVAELPYDPAVLIDPPDAIVRFASVLASIVTRSARPLVDAAVDAAIAAHIATHGDAAEAWARGPALAHRIAFALGLAVELGHLEPAGTWRVHLVDRDGLRTALLGPVLDLLCDVAAVAGLPWTVSEIRCGRGIWRTAARGATFEAATDRLGMPQVWVEVDVDGPLLDPDAAATSTAAILRDAPSVVVRPAPPTTRRRAPLPSAVVTTDTGALQRLSSRVGDGADAGAMAALICGAPAPGDTLAWGRESAAAARVESPDDASAGYAAALTEVTIAGPAARDRWAGGLVVGGSRLTTAQLVHLATEARLAGRSAWCLDVWDLGAPLGARLALADAALADAEAGVDVAPEELCLAMAERLASVSAKVVASISGPASAGPYHRADD